MREKTPGREPVNHPPTPSGPALRWAGGTPPFDPEDPLPTLVELSADELVRISLSLFDNERFGESAALLRYVLVFRNRSTPVWAWLGRCHEGLGDFSTAAAIYDAASLHASACDGEELRQCAARARESEQRRRRAQCASSGGRP